MKLMRSTLFVLICTLALAGCGGSDKDSTASMQPTHQNLLTQAAYQTGQASGQAALTRRITYRMPAVRGGDTQATAAVFVPKGTAPAGGWPMIVWAHGTTGVADGCEPTATMDLSGYDPLIAELVRQGYMVVAPDYEGLGNSPAENHPYLVSASEARSLIYAATAAKQLVPETGSQWLAMGHSQGGHAALAAADFLASDAMTQQIMAQAGLNLNGVVALAPASNLDKALDGINQQIGQLQAAAASEPQQAGIYIEQAGALMVMRDAFGSLLVAGQRALQPGLNYTDVFGGQSASLAALNEQPGQCLGQVGERIATSVRQWLTAGNLPTTYGGLRQDFSMSPAGQAFLNNSRIGAVKLTVPVLVVQGADDQTVFPSLTGLLMQQMSAAGNQVTALSQGGVYSDAQVVQLPLANQAAGQVTLVNLGTDAAVNIDHTGVVAASVNVTSRFVAQRFGRTN